jgi:hypothetical protein
MFLRKIRTAKGIIKQGGLRQLANLALRRLSPGAADKLTSAAVKAGINFRFWLHCKRFPSRRIVFVTFADGQRFTTDRLVAEVSALDIFDEVVGYGPAMLSKQFVTRYGEHLKHPRGLGFWVWKPQVLLQAFEKLGQGDIVVYADAGCTVLPQSGPVLKSLLLEVSESSAGMMATLNPVPFITRQWTKADLLAHFGWQRDERVLDSRLIEAGRLALVRSEENTSMIEQWLDIAADLHLIDDSPSIVPNASGFIEHRHDQSIFSLLIRNREVLTGLERVFDTTRLRAPTSDL